MRSWVLGLFRMEKVKHYLVFLLLLLLLYSFTGNAFSFRNNLAVSRNYSHEFPMYSLICLVLTLRFWLLSRILPISSVYSTLLTRPSLEYSWLRV